MFKYETDSRKVKNGQIFVAPKGLTADGHDYIKEAIKNGASMVVSEKELDIDIPYIRTDDTYDYLKNVLSKEYGNEIKKMDLIGFTTDNKLLLVNATGEEAVKMGMRDGLQFGPFLMVNGEKPKFKDSAGGFSRAARVAIAQRKDGIVLFLATEGTHTAGPNMKEVVDTLEKYGAYNAANLDGGTSTQLVIKGKLINHPKNIMGQAVTGGRGIITGWGLFLDK